jgi:hypothetical protein
VLTDTEGESKDESESKDEDKADETDNEVSDEETKTEGEQTKNDEKADEESIDPAENARRRYEERQAAIAERKASVDQRVQEYVNAPSIDQTGQEVEVTDAERRIRAIEAAEFSRKVENNVNKVVSEFERIKTDPELEMFDEDSENFNKKATDKAFKEFVNGYEVFDDYGNLIEVKGSLYQHLKETADLLQGAVKSGQIKQVRDGRKMKTNADAKPAATPKETEKDPIMEILKSR